MSPEMKRCPTEIRKHRWARNWDVVRCKPGSYWIPNVPPRTLVCFCALVVVPKPQKASLSRILENIKEKRKWEIQQAQLCRIDKSGSRHIHARETACCGTVSFFNEELGCPFQHVSHCFIFADACPTRTHCRIFHCTAQGAALNSLGQNAVVFDVRPLSCIARSGAGIDARFFLLFASLQ